MTKQEFIKELYRAGWTAQNDPDHIKIRDLLGKLPLFPEELPDKWDSVYCDDCKRSVRVHRDVSPSDVVKHVCNEYGWFFGGCNTALLCDKCKLENPWYQKSRKVDCFDY